MPQSMLRILFRFLGSINLAITLVVTIAIAKVGSGKSMAWWAHRFFVTLFASLGVNLILSGLHSYGEL
jgi:ABC-type transport system involved in cytochrome c biogenesis permease subunit